MEERAAETIKWIVPEHNPRSGPVVRVALVRLNQSLSEGGGVGSFFMSCKVLGRVEERSTLADGGRGGWAPGATRRFFIISVKSESLAPWCYCVLACKGLGADVAEGAEGGGRFGKHRSPPMDEGRIGCAHPPLASGGALQDRGTLTMTHDITSYLAL